MKRRAQKLLRSREKNEEWPVSFRGKAKRGKTHKSGRAARNVLQERPSRQIKSFIIPFKGGGSKLKGRLTTPGRNVCAIGKGLKEKSKNLGLGSVWTGKRVGHNVEERDFCR